MKNVEKRLEINKKRKLSKNEKRYNNPNQFRKILINKILSSCKKKKL